MVSIFDMSHLKKRYQAMIKDRSVKLHATLSELLGTGIVVFIGTYSSGIVTEAQASLLKGHPANMELHYQFFISALVFGLMYFAIMCATRVHGAAHLNPVITVASMLAGLTGLVQGLLHITAQVLGAIIGSAIVRGLTPSGDRDDALFGANILFDTDDVNKSRAFGAEIMGTFILTYIYLQVFSHPKSEHRKIAPLAVGLSYVALLTAVGPVSSASLNPARSLGPATVSGEGDELWIWTIGPLIGAVIAVPFHLLSVTDLPEMDKDGNMIKKSSSAVDIAQADPKRVAVPQSAAAEQRVGGMV